MEMQSAIVTGGAGFIGSHIVDALIARGVRVTVVDREDPTPERRNAAARYMKQDVKDDGLRHTFTDAAADVVFHCAAHIDDRASVREPLMNAEENIIGSINVFEAARQTGVQKIIFLSTGVVYGNADVVPTPESTLPKPLTPYGVSKLSGERYLNFYWLLYKLPYVVLRLSNVYGPRQDASKECGAIAIFTNALLRGMTPTVNNDGKTTRDYVHVQDVVTACMAAAARDVVGVYNIGTGIETATETLYDAVARAVGVSAAPSHGDTPDAVKRCALDATKASSDLSWQPTIVLADGIANTVAWYRRQGI